MSELKVKKLGKAGYMICIGADGTNGEWYFMTEPVKKFVDSNGIKDGDSVEIESQKTDKGKLSLTRISRAGSGGGSQVQPAPSVGQEVKKSGWQLKTPAESASIVRQSVGHMTSRVVCGMCTSGAITDPVQACTAMELIYKKFQELVG